MPISFILGFAAKLHNKLGSVDSTTQAEAMMPRQPDQRHAIRNCESRTIENLLQTGILLCFDNPMHSSHGHKFRWTTIPYPALYLGNCRVNRHSMYSYPKYTELRSCRENWQVNCGRCTH